MFVAKPEVPQKSSLQMKQDDKFFSMLLSKETSISNPSFRVPSVSVPFVWESQPGTPKYTFSHHTLPPLTPPPSYYFNTINNNPLKKNNNMFMALFQKLNLKKTIMSPSSLSSSWPSSNNSSSKVGSIGKNGRRGSLSYVPSIEFRGDGEDGVISPTSTLCFGIPRMMGRA
ncbi:hypothetical protein TanjilG_19271 [Lupinus angustifolius]|uniref:Uncharacterized protein n=1 Tax=Lupinus angustifolius TaxID=3871 RepID=A0A1J7H3W4_LUPAN|nr:PREDICTED: uncharacterized protein LOC109353087 [Lupinus angustifolius]OIW07430.1 hypothetical protein TanjilG_19271 [Lupinus angustifolius]